MRIAVAHLYHESNTFCREKTCFQDFELLQGEAMLSALPGVEILQAAGAQVVPTLYAQKWSSGMVEETAFMEFENRILNRLAAEDGALDGIYLSLHGAMTVENVGSGEFHLLTRIRELLGEAIPIAVSMDMHANLPEGIEKLANVITGYHTAPHTDAEETQRKAVRALLRILESGEAVHPEMVTLPMLLAGERALSRDEPLRSIYARCGELEKDPRFLAATLFVGMAWSDTPHSRCSVLVTPSSMDSALMARKEALDMAAVLFAHRDECPYAHPTFEMEEAVRRALDSRNAPLYLSDSGDNPTAGGEGDTTCVLQEMMRLDPDKRVLFAPLMDDVHFSGISELAEGTECSLEIGTGRNRDCAPAAGRFKLLRKGEVLSWHGSTLSKAADFCLLRWHHLDVILVNRSMAMTGMECFESAGVSITDYAVVVLKMGYMYAEIARPCRENIMALTPGNTPLKMTAGQYQHLTRPIWPLDREVSWHA